MTTQDDNKEKFKLVERSEADYHDTSIAGKPVGFFKDGLTRFKKNKISVVAFWIIAILMFFTLIGPVMRNYSLDRPDVVPQATFQYLSPRIPFLENFGIFDGTRVVLGRNRDFIESLPDGIVIGIVNERIINGVSTVDVRVNYYRFRAYTSSHRSAIDLQTGEYVIPTFNLTEEQFQTALDRNAVLELISFNEGAGLYTVRLDTFLFSFGTGPDDVYFWFGTGIIGEDLFTELWNSSRVSITLAIIVSIINLTIGVVVGTTVGYFGGKLDIIFERFVDIISGLPFMAIITLLILSFGISFPIIVMAFILQGWIGAYSLSRVQAYRYRSREFVLAARTYGASNKRIIFKHILPNGMGTLITVFALAIPGFIFAESGLVFLGIIQYPDGIKGIGRLLSEGQAVMQQYPHLLLFPSIFISLLMLSFNMFSNGLRDGFNPSLRGVEE